jgi:CRP-like cAMP-binding protein
MKKPGKIDQLRAVSLFAGCSRQELGLIAGITDIVTVAAGRVLAKEGEPGRECFVVLAGEARVRVGRKSRPALGPGSVFGDMALLDGGLRTATVTAVTPMTLLVLDGRGFGALLNKAPSVARKVLAAMAQRIRRAEGSPTL